MTRPLIILPVAASVLIVAAVLVALWMIGSASGERAKFSSLEVAPRDVDLFLAINTDPTSPQWLAVNDSLGDLGVKDPIREAIDEALAEFDLEWERDILPVAGDEAYFSVPDVREIEDDTGWVAGIRLADADKARDVFDRLREEEDAPKFGEEEYQGIAIHYVERETFDFNEETGEFEAGTEPGSALAFVEDVLALGGSVDDLKSVIDVVQGRAESAEENERLQDFRRHQREDFLVWGYADLENVWDAAEDSFDEFGASAAPVPAPAVSSEPPAGGQAGDRPQPTVTPINSPYPSDYAIRSFDSEYTIQIGGKVQVRETIVVDFGNVEKHGIFRDLPTQVEYDFINLRVIGVEPLSVMRDGAPEPFDVIEFPQALQLKIGDPDVTLLGQHEYVIEYELSGAVDQFPGDPATYALYWNTTGNEWSTSIEAVKVTVRVPDGHVFWFNECFEESFDAEVVCESVADDPSQGIDETTAVFRTLKRPIPPGGSLWISTVVQGESGAPDPVLIPNPEFEDFEDFPTDDEFPFPDEEPFEFPFGSEEIIEELRGTYDRVGFALTSFDEGFAFDLTVVHAPGFEPERRYEPTAAYIPALAQLLPAETMFMVSMFDVYEQMYLPAKAAFEGVESVDGKTWDDYLADFEEETGLELEDDILALLNGEIAFAGDVRDFDADEPDFELFAIADLSDPAQAEASLEELEGYLEDRGEIVADSDGGLHVWTDPDEPGAESIGITVRDTRLIIGYPASAAADVADGVSQSLASTEDWLRTMELLPEDKTFVAFVSLARILEELDGTAAEADFEESTDGEVTLDDLAPLRSIGFAGTSRDDGFGFHAVLFMED